MPPEFCDVQARENIARLNGKFAATVERIDGTLKGMGEDLGKLQKDSAESVKALAVIQAKFEADKWLLDKKIAAAFLLLSPLIVFICNLILSGIGKICKHILGL